MAVPSIVRNLPARDRVALARFRDAVFGLKLPHDMGRIAFPGGPHHASPRQQLASTGGSDTHLPARTVKIDDLVAVEDGMRRTGVKPAYGPVTDPWGIRRVYRRDPEGNHVNIAVHTEPCAA